MGANGAEGANVNEEWIRVRNLTGSRVPLATGGSAIEQLNSAGRGRTG